jgi:PAS domain S-box-containing protein
VEISSIIGAFPNVLSETKLGNTLDILPDAIAFCSMDGEILECNQAMVELLRYKTKKDLIGKPCNELIAQSDYQKGSKVLDELRTVGLVKHLELRIKDSANEELTVIFSGRRLIDDSSGLAIGYLAVAKDITEYKKIENSLKQRLHSENALSTISSRFVSFLDFDVAVNSSLMDIGKLCNASRSYVFVFDSTQNTISKIYEWCANGVRSQNEGLQNATAADFSWWINNLKQGSTIQIEDTSKMPVEAKAEREILEQQGIRSLIVLPLYIASQLEGFVGLDNVESTGTWSEEHIAVLRIFSEIMGMAIGGKRSLDALQASQELSRAIVVNAPIGIATADKSQHFVTANEAFCRILGYSENELKKLTFKEITYPVDLQKSINEISALEQGKTETNSFTLEKRYIRKDGTLIVGRVIVNKIKDVKGKTPFFIVELEDITANKQLADKLLASEERFRAISTSATDAIILMSDDGKVIYWNPSAERTFGYLAEEVLDKKLSEIIVPPYGNDKHAELLRQLGLNSFPKKRFEVSAQKKDGTIFPLDLSVSSVKLRDKNCMLAIAQDVTERKAMEEALRQERDMLEDMASNIGAGLTIITKDYRVLWANQLLKKIMNKDNLENEFCHSIYNKSGGICRDCSAKKIFEKEVSVDRHDYHIKNGDYEKWVELIATPVKDEDGNVVAALELAVDITERKKLQDKLADYSLKLEETVQSRTEQLKITQAELVKSERLAAIGELAGMVGHDLRNPLTGIKNAAYYLAKKGNSIPETKAKEMLETIDKCVNYSNKIVGDLLDYSKEIRLNITGTSPGKLLDEALVMVNVPQNVTILNQLPDQPRLKIDPDKVERVFINLIKNAIDAMPNGGKITVSSIEVNGSLEMFFADTGTGIAEEILPKLFSPLLTTKAQGMGFGLAICKRIIESHGGAISVKTTQGKGTVFSITLPIEPKLETGGEK